MRLRNDLAVRHLVLEDGAPAQLIGGGEIEISEPQPDQRSDLPAVIAGDEFLGVEAVRLGERRIEPLQGVHIHGENYVIKILKNLIYHAECATHFLGEIARLQCGQTGPDDPPFRSPNQRLLQLRVAI